MTSEKVSKAAEQNIPKLLTHCNDKKYKILPREEWEISQHNNSQDSSKSNFFGISSLFGDRIVHHWCEETDSLHKMLQNWENNRLFFTHLQILNCIQFWIDSSFFILEGEKKIIK